MNINKCVSIEAKNFENELDGMCITYMQFVNLKKMWDELTQSGKTEVDNILRTYEEELELLAKL